MDSFKVAKKKNQSRKGDFVTFQQHFLSIESNMARARTENIHPYIRVITQPGIGSGRRLDRGSILFDLLDSNTTSQQKEEEKRRSTYKRVHIVVKKETLFLAMPSAACCSSHIYGSNSVYKLMFTMEIIPVSLLQEYLILLLNVQTLLSHQDPVLNALQPIENVTSPNVNLVTHIYKPTTLSININLVLII